HACRGAADCRALQVGGAERIVAGAILRGIADTARRPALGRRRPEGIRRAVVGHAVAALGEVTRARRGPADRTALQIVRTLRARPGTRLRQVADARGRTAGRGSVGERVGRAVIAQAVAALRDVTDPGRAAAHRRALVVGRTLGAEAVAELG